MGQNKFFQISFFTCKKTHLIKKGSRLKLYQMFNSTSKASESWDLEVFGKVPRSWDSPGTLGLSLDIGTVPKSQSPDIFQEYIIFIKDLRYMGQSRDLEVFGRVPRSWDSPGTLGLSRDVGTAPRRWDCPKDPEP